MVMFYRIFSEQNPVNFSVKAFKRYSMLKPVIFVVLITCFEIA